MSSVPLFGSLIRSLRESRRKRQIEQALQWPAVEARVNLWHIIQADPELTTAARPHQIEASFSFVRDGEYFGGYLRSIPMTHHEAESHSKGEPAVIVRQDPKDPNHTLVLAEDNRGRLPFEIISG